MFKKILKLLQQRSNKYTVDKSKEDIMDVQLHDYHPEYIVSCIFNSNLQCSTPHLYCHMCPNEPVNQAIANMIEAGKEEVAMCDFHNKSCCGSNLPCDVCCGNNGEGYNV